MQISTARFFSRSSAQMSRMNSDMNRLLTELSTKKLTAASQDSTAWMMLGGIKRDEADSDAYRANMTLSRGLLAQADTTLGSVDDRLVRVRELAVRAGSETLNDQDRIAIGNELGQIREGLLALANSRDVRGHTVFGGVGDAAFAADADGAIKYTGIDATGATTVDVAATTAIRIGDASQVQVGIDGSRVFGGAAGTVDVFQMIDDLRAAMEISLTEPVETNTTTDPSAPVTDLVTTPASELEAARTKYATTIQNALSQLDTAQGQVTSARASNGARAARLEIESAQLDTAGIDREEARTALEDTDIPATMVEFQKTMTILNATQAAVSKLAGLSLFNYLK